MKRNLIKQIIYEWRTNVWLVIELAVVTLAVWAVLSVLWVQNKGFIQPRGFDPVDVYSITVNSINPSSPYYLPDYKDNYFEDRDELIHRLKQNPNVEDVSLVENMMPYNYNYMGNILQIEGEPDSVFFSGNFRVAQPGIIKILGIKSMTGKSPEQLTEMLARGEVLIAPSDNYEEKYGPTRNLIGRNVFLFGREEHKAKVGDMIQEVRRTDYEPARGGMVLIPFEKYPFKYGDIALKVKPGRSEAFEKNLKEDRSLTNLRNVFLSDIKKLTDIGESLHRATETNIRLNLGVSFFLLVTVFLGLLGSFWFRIQQRTSEIAIRKTFGAKDSDLFRRIIGEGMVLLLAALILVSASVWPFIGKINEYLNENWWIFLALEGITAGAIAIGIVLSLWYPAYRAMHIEPAIAIKSE